MPNAPTAAPRRRGDLKEALVAHALAAAEAGTIEAMSLRQASRELGVSPGAAYRHFSGRDALLRTVAERGFDRLAVRFEAALPFASEAAAADDARARFVALGRAYVAFALAHSGLWRLMFGPHGLAPDGDGGDRPSTYAWLEKSLAELARFGMIAPADAAARLFAWSAIHGLAGLRLAGPAAADDDDDAVAAQCGFIIAALRPGANRADRRDG